MHVSAPQYRNTNSQAPAGQSIYIPEETVGPFTHTRIPDGVFVPIPQHIRPFLDTKHEPTASGYVPNRRADGSDDMNMANDYYYKIRRLSPVRHPATNRVLSAYSGVELKPDSNFSAHQFDEYIFHAVRKSRLFMFRVEKQAALTGHRHPRGLESTRCRFAKCPIDGTIRPGQIRVCISEFLDPRNEVLDPYHNAAYVHLYCLENFCNLPSLLAETNVAFLPAGQLAKESYFPPALNAAEREACLQWADQARQHWRNFKRAYPLPEARPRYKPSDHDRLYYRLEQIRESHKVTNKRWHEDYNGPQVYTYNNQGQRDPAPEPAPKKPRIVPPRIPIPASGWNSGAIICQGPLPHRMHSPTSLSQIFNNKSIPTDAPLPPSPGDILPSRPTEGAQLQLYTNGVGGLGEGAEYSTEEINTMLAEYFTNEDFASISQPMYEELPCNEPEQAPQPEQDNQLVAAVKTPVVTEGWHKPRRSSAPPVLSVQNARIRKSSAASRRNSKTKDRLVAEADLEELHKGS
ncbi:hypothetical protein INS49_006405 [Diaporthe citri]|uniref:uncharacterized protein n=1 Tax=Diaporthe citri TaxID=83186 RepID=UPI001C7F3EC7|nr:uncharacterized protein INS49_006405 [Diaporthe citri]KAG6364801.1 hypothetical protein INS49_006405 [Diaporthe citri]